LHFKKQFKQPINAQINKHIYSIEPLNVCLVYNVLRIWEISVMIYACIVDHTHRY